MVDARHIQSFADRILSLKADEDQIKKDIRGIYEEAVDSEIDKTGLGQLVTYLRKREKNVNEFDAKEAISLGYLELYNASLTRAHAYARAMDGVIIEPNSAPTDAPAGSMADSDGGVDATTVAPIQPETANSGEAQAAVGESPATTEAVGGDHDNGAEKAGAPVHEATDKPVGASLQNMQETPAAPLYAEPGIIVMEKCPQRGIVAHPYAACWPVNKIDVPGGVREPIVKIDHFILDGRGRYFAAREAGIEYPVVQYDGADPLLDCIRWNLASRTIAGEPKRIVAHKLCKLEPDRADEIMSAMGLAEEKVAAE